MSYRKKHIHPKIRTLKKKKHLLKRPLFWLLFLLVALVAGSLYCVLFLPQVQITNITVLGNQKITTDSLSNLAWANIHKKILDVGIASVSSSSIFLTNTDAIKKDILNTFGDIENVKIKKNWLQGITLTVQERKAYAVFCQSQQSGQDQCFYLDHNGIIFEQVPGTENMMVIRQDPENTTLSLGQTAVAKNIVGDIENIQKNLKNNFQVDVAQVLISGYLIVTTSEHWQIWFDTNADINGQITKMNALLQDTIAEKTRKNLQYIYLQYKDRAYYK